MTPPSSAAELPANHLALLLAGRCSRCAELVPGGTALRGAPCPACGSDTAPAPEDRAVLATRFAERTHVRAWLAVLVVAAATLFAGWAPLLGSLCVGAGLLWVGLAIVRPGVRLLSVRRRIVASWTLRIVGASYFALLVVLIELLTLVPIFGIAAKTVIAALQVAFGAWFARTYLAWQAGREARAVPIAIGELLFLGLAAVLLVGGMAAVFAIVAWVLAKAGMLTGAMP